MRLPLFSSSGVSTNRAAKDRNAPRPPQPYSRNSLEKTSRLQGATKVDSLCPYCAVGCGANIFQLEKNPHKVRHAMYRAPYSGQWQQVSLDWALDRSRAG